MMQQDVHEQTRGSASAHSRLPSREFLVFVRAGADSLHRDWLAQDPDRNWDCVVSWWGREPPANGEELQVSGGSLKLDSFVDFYRSHRALVAGYRHVLIADDDIRFAPGAISRLFDICAQRHLPLAQPALRWGTWVNQPVTMRNPFTEVREVSFVEIMVPVFDQPTLQALIDTFLMTRSGVGVDVVWSYRLQARHAIFVVDSVCVDHTKPVDMLNGELYRRMRAVGVDPWLDYDGMRKRLPVAGGFRTLADGHVYRRGLPPAFGRMLVYGYSQLGRLTFRMGVSNGRLRQRLARIQGRPAAF
jgi:hypothetical protein